MPPADGFRQKQWRVEQT